jgi:myo-inositol-1-phosphate synthase
MRSGDRGAQKKFTKENSIRTLLSSADTGLSVGPSDFVPALADYKVGYFSIKGEGILGMPFKLDMKIELEDSPNSAGVVVNAIRAAKVAADRGRVGLITEVCPYFFKDPPVVTSEEESLSCFDKFILEVEND